MYRITKPGYRKSDQDKRWALPDRIFFACGACHILAHAFLEKWGDVETKVLWIKPAPGFTGNHIVIDGGDWIFDYHGYSIREVFLSHTFRKARRWWPGWDATLVPLPRHILMSEARSRAEGLWLREPRQFLHDPLPRARSYLSGFPSPATIRDQLRPTYRKSCRSA
jgi:hypothetical protein